MTRYSKENNVKGYQVWMPLLLSMFSVLGMLIGYNLQKTPTVASFDEEPVKKYHNPYGMGRVEEVLRYVENQYVDEVESDKLVEDAIDHLLEELDPHSNYITVDELKTVNENLEGSFVGIGIEFDILQDSIYVITPIVGGPSEKQGIMAGDRIVMIEDSLVAGIGITTGGVTRRLKGNKGSEVKLGIKRRTQAGILDFTIKRDEIPLNSVDAHFMLDKKTGYLKINRFSGTTYDEFMAGLDELVEAGAEDLIIDLRQNPGGYLTEATRILNQLIRKRNEMLVYTEGEHSAKRAYTTKGIVKHKLDDIAVLIDEGSASASEIMAGALQDTDRGIIVGRRSFGKGLVQEQYDLTDGSALRLTVARYYTKSGRLIQKSYEDETQYDSDRENRFKSGELKNRDSIHLADTTRYFTDNGRVVYASGGIIPDLFVPIRNILENKLYIEASIAIPDFVYTYLDEKRMNLLEMDKEIFLRDFKIGDSDFERFKKYVVSKNNKLGTEDWAVAEDGLKQLIKARIARNLFGQDYFYKVLNQTDPIMIKTLQVLDDSKDILKNK